MPTGGLRVRSPRFWQRRVWSHTTRHRSDLHYDLILYEHLFKYCVMSKIADTLVYNSWRSNINVDGIQLIWNHGMLIYIYIYIYINQHSMIPDQLYSVYVDVTSSRIIYKGICNLWHNAILEQMFVQDQIVMQVTPMSCCMASDSPLSKSGTPNP